MVELLKIIVVKLTISVVSQSTNNEMFFSYFNVWNTLKCTEKVYGYFKEILQISLKDSIYQLNMLSILHMAQSVFGYFVWMEVKTIPS